MTGASTEDEVDFTTKSEPTSARRWLRSVVIIALTFHALSLIYVLVPESAVRQLLTPLFRTYQAATGTEQHWDMFSSVSNHHAYEATVEVRESGGSVNVLGPILPGLKPTPDYFRYHTFLTRIDSDRFKVFRAPYAEGIRTSLVERGVTGRSFEIRKAAQRLRFLDAIRTTGEIGYDGTEINGPFPLDRPVENLTGSAETE